MSRPSSTRTVGVSTLRRGDIGLGPFLGKGYGCFRRTITLSETYLPYGLLPPNQQTSQISEAARFTNVVGQKLDFWSGTFWRLFAF